MASCSSGAAGALPPTATSVRVVQVTQAPETPRALHSVATASSPSNAPADEPQPADCPPAAGSVPVLHTVDAALNFSTRRAEVSHQISYRNESSQPLADLGLNVEANRFPNAFNLERVLVNGQPAPSFELTGRRLTVTLDQPLAPGCALVLELDYRMSPPPLGEGAAALSGYFSVTPRQVNLGDWLPTLSVRRDGQWISNDSAGVGEQTLAAPADWDVSLRVTDARDSLRLAAPGEVISTGEHAWRIRLPAARDFSISLSEHFQPPLTRRVNGVTIELFALADRPAANHALTTAADALALFEDLYGDYPYDRYVVVEGDFPDGMEHSGLVFVGTNWFNGYANDPAGYLTLITAHEAAHQWWYGLVGSDSAIDPWLDEALSTYSEYVFLEEYYPELRDWWWDFRVNTFVGGEGPFLSTDQPVYAFRSVREYINSVYLRGAKLLQGVRDVIGTDDFFALLRAYADANRGRIARPQSFWSLLSPYQLAATADVRAEYLGDIYALPTPTPDVRGG
ncbi:MAG TPA: M1 family aminopeptidase [Candidatus Limnocylindrales bacterium]|nr:M1 family aminopeptidase [Candidatus Limnocylindrales bacterium]